MSIGSDHDGRIAGAAARPTAPNDGLPAGRARTEHSRSVVLLRITRTTGDRGRGPGALIPRYPDSSYQAFCAPDSWRVGAHRWHSVALATASSRPSAPARRGTPRRFGQHVPPPSPLAEGAQGVSGYSPVETNDAVVHEVGDETGGMTESFQRLLGFESRELVDAFSSGLHGRSLNARQARSIVSSFRQGRMLFESAAVTETLARPITQFYGVSAISRGLAIVLTRGGSEESLSRGHGLKIGTFGGTVSELKVDVTNGLFTDLTAALGGATVRVRTGAPDWYLPLPDIAPGTTLAIDEVSRLLPGLARELRQWTGFQPPPSLALEECDAGDGQTRRWRFSGQSDDAGLLEQFGSPSATVENSVVVAPEDYVPQVAQSFVFEKIGHLVLQEPIADDIRLSPLQTMFVVSFALSMLARYRPSQWMEVLSGVGADRMFPFVRAFLDFNQRWFPELAADHLQFAAKCDYSMIPNTRTD